MTPELSELKPMVYGLSECANLVVRPGDQASLRCEVSSKLFSFLLHENTFAVQHTEKFADQV